MSKSNDLIVPSNYDSKNIKLGNKKDLRNNTFRIIDIKYKRDNSTNDECALKLKGRVNHVVIPKESKPYQKYTAIVVFDDDETINFLNTISNDIIKCLYDNREKYLPDLEEDTTFESFKGECNTALVNYNAQYNSNTMFINFSDATTIKFSNSVPDEIKNATNAYEKITKGTIITFAAKVSNITYSLSKETYNIKVDVPNMDCIDFNDTTMNRQEASGMSIDSINPEFVRLLPIEINEYKGHYSKIKYSETSQNSGSTVNVLFKNVDAFYIKSESLNKPGTYNYSIAINIDDPNKFNAIDEQIVNTLKENLKNKDKNFEKCPVKIKQIDKIFKGSLKQKDNSDEYTLWVSVYTTTDENENVNFGDKFIRCLETDSDEFEYKNISSEDVENELFESPKRFASNINAYIRYLWYGNKISVKWYLGKANILGSGTIEYDLGDNDNSPVSQEHNEDGPDTVIDSDEEDNSESNNDESNADNNSADEATSDDE